MSGIPVRFEILPNAQLSLWPDLSGARDLGLVLYGGTAIALRLGHRSSIDFDFFTERDLDRVALDRAFSFFSRSTFIQEQKNTISLLVPTLEGAVKVSFFGQIGFGRVGTPDTTSDGVLEIASLLDLLATKLKVIQQRIEAKDYRDIVAILRSGVPLDEGLSAATALFGSTFQPSEALKSLGYFEGGDLETLTPPERQTLTAAIARVRHVQPRGIISPRLSA